MARDKEKKSASNKKWATENPEKKAAYDKKWNAENKDKKAATNKKWRANNKENQAAYNKQWYAKNPAYSKQRERAGNAGRFGISLEDALALQDNRCAMCWETEPRSNQGNLLPWAFDHDHACCPSGKGCPSCFRGILCNNCNRSLGYAKDSAAIMQRGAEYLKVWETKKGRGPEAPPDGE
jgi:hypothetical protein